MISLQQAHQHISRIKPLQPVAVPLKNGLGLVCADDTYAVANCPSVDSSLKDGFAICSTDIAGATPVHSVNLSVQGTFFAGNTSDNFHVTPGTAVKIMTGAPVPSGATAILASEFAQLKDNMVTIWADASPGRNILGKGSDIKKGQLVVAGGTILTPTHLGLLASAGLNEMSCYPRPRVAIAATGSELVWPGEPVSLGKVAASNMAIAAAELQALGISATLLLLRDNLSQLEEQFRQLASEVDLLITCGGVLDGDKDLTMKAMEKIGMEKIFHRVRIGPGKGACMGRVGTTIVFNLPGGPPSNHVALLLLALPGVRRQMGFTNFLPQKKDVFATEELRGQKDWTQLIYSRAVFKQGCLSATPLCNMARLQAMAAANALIEIPEECHIIGEGSLAPAWFF